MGYPLAQTGLALAFVEVEHQLDRINIGKIFKDLKLKA
jgi:hypothetical protein